MVVTGEPVHTRKTIPGSRERGVKKRRLLLKIGAIEFRDRKKQRQIGGHQPLQARGGCPVVWLAAVISEMKLIRVRLGDVVDPGNQHCAGNAAIISFVKSR